MRRPAPWCEKTKKTEKETRKESGLNPTSPEKSSGWVREKGCLRMDKQEQGEGGGEAILILLPSTQITCRRIIGHRPPDP